MHILFDNRRQSVASFHPELLVMDGIRTRAKFEGDCLDEPFFIKYKYENACDSGSDAPTSTNSTRHRTDSGALHYAATPVHRLTAANIADSSNCKSWALFFSSELMSCGNTSNVWTTVRETRHCLYFA